MGDARERIAKDSLNLSTNSTSIQIISFSKEIMRRFLEILERGIFLKYILIALLSSSFAWEKTELFIFLYSLAI